MKIEEGDGVEIVKKGDEDFPDYIPIGAVGEVANIDPNLPYNYRVEFPVNYGEYEDDDYNYFNEEELSPINRCDKHGKRLYNEREEEYFCPFCERE